ncbi:hypothetical protein Tdes44962_MAKER02230 [Teratosphaeria destructans]|uniref:Uncharacterized protein n=1 Tax=Teratosphaeria destructans TaxID=418781 RepID=A0A9W7SUE6_9PEZI|nr:hypothetical protein Tdes44962_MAKER02230 [Teratosphaeria destructans]
MKQALEQDVSLTLGIWEYAFGFACKADELMQKEANRKIIGTIWFRGMDKYHSFDTRWWVTNLNVLTINLTPPADRNAGQRAYLTAIEEARSAASTQFAAREHYIQLWMQGQGGLPAWTKGAEKHYLRLLKWSEDMLGEMERQLLQPGNEARVPAMDEKVLEQVTGQMNDVGKMVREEFNAGDLARKTEVLQIVGTAKGVEGAFGI